MTNQQHLLHDSMIINGHLHSKALNCRTLEINEREGFYQLLGWTCPAKNGVDLLSSSYLHLKILMDGIINAEGFLIQLPLI